MELMSHPSRPPIFRTRLDGTEVVYELDGDPRVFVKEGRVTAFDTRSSKGQALGPGQSIGCDPGGNLGPVVSFKPDVLPEPFRATDSDPATQRANSTASPLGSGSREPLPPAASVTDAVLRAPVPISAELRDALSALTEKNGVDAAIPDNLKYFALFNKLATMATIRWTSPSEAEREAGALASATLEFANSPSVRLAFGCASDSGAIVPLRGESAGEELSDSVDMLLSVLIGYYIVGVEGIEALRNEILVLKRLNTLRQYGAALNAATKRSNGVEFPPSLDRLWIGHEPFLEKPLSLTESETEEVVLPVYFPGGTAIDQPPRLLLVEPEADMEGGRCVLLTDGRALYIPDAKYQALREQATSATSGREQP